jgi:glycosyltransferase involved in cell wall biosynthesis
MIIAVSHHAKRSHIRWGINGRKIDVLHNCIVLSDFMIDSQFNPEQKKHDIGLRPDSNVVCNVAALTPVKGQKYLLEAMSKVVKIIPHTTLLIVGDGSLRSQLQMLANKLDIARNVIFMGVRKDVPELLAISDIFVLSSLSEGISISGLEAMSMRLPVVATAAEGNLELVVNHETGLLVPSRDAHGLAEAILYLLQSDEKKKAFGIAGRRRVEKHFSSDVIVPKLECIYKKLLTQKGSNDRFSVDYST